MDLYTKTNNNWKNTVYTKIYKQVQTNQVICDIKWTGRTPPTVSTTDLSKSLLLIPENPDAQGSWSLQEARSKFNRHDKYNKHDPVANIRIWSGHYLVN